jgi:hypothetical protein
MAPYRTKKVNDFPEPSPILPPRLIVGRKKRKVGYLEIYLAISEEDKSILRQEINETIVGMFTYCSFERNKDIYLLFYV